MPPSKPTSSARATLADVARHVGVSAMTVSRAISQPDSVAKPTRDRIMAAVKKLGYLPNMAAGTLRSSQSFIIGGVVPTLGFSIFGDTVQGISDVLNDSGYQLILGCSGYSLENEEKLVTALIGRQADGIILTGTLHSPELVPYLRGSGIPTVEMWDISEPRIDMAVGFSNFDLGQEIGRHLVACGYRRLGYVSGTPEHEKREKRAAARSRGFLAAVREAGLAPPARVSVPDPLDMEGSGVVAADFIAAHPEIDALLCINEIVGVGTLYEAQRRGWKIPQKLGIAGMGDANIAHLVHPGLTTIHIPGYKIGQLSAEMMLARLSHGRVKKRAVDVGFELVIRGSTRLPEKAGPAKR
ncbi:LacI family transcriptional regulator [Hypericibacter terrae]|jgi:LacI family gluconate utilization system Gnt-I transcriptional repressor|uniref:LacI family transcriptional regulator n=1 Tax=Hypericibacter terrae TaxID=2602015 RepID=A0A5J6MIH5_9PROT|nr:LacI family DNA-binding transcriptional regulator [Hypericibacter terrae]QEX16335.1 LacI family transcriptional regulator [Hypericibacter terrae]